jgi:hypothetical protein
MQGVTQPKSNSLNCLGETKFNYKYPEHVYLIDLEKNCHEIGIQLRILYKVHDPNPSLTTNTGYSWKPYIEFELLRLGLNSDTTPSNLCRR